MATFITHSMDETHALGARLGERLEAGDVVLLYGDLGAGKTIFTQGIAAGMGVRGPVTSPTFTLIHEHAGQHLALFHFDPFRLEGPREIAELGFDEYRGRLGVVVVEWAERLGTLTPSEHLSVRLETRPDDSRSIVLNACGARYACLLSNLEAPPC